MSRVTPRQASFNGGEISQRLRARSDLNIYGIALAEMTGFAPLVEGAAEAMPGTIHVAAAPGPCRLVRFEYNTTQGHVLEFSAALVRVYTNDGLLDDGSGSPVAVASPYSFEQVQALRFHQSYDVLYCFHATLGMRRFVRSSATDFAFEDLVLENGPFDPRNKDETVTVTASALSGTVTLTASAAIFAATDVGSLFQMEAEDLGDVPRWEPGIKVSAGQYLCTDVNVYRVVGGGGAMRTGNIEPSHKKGAEWDGIGTGTDINGDSAYGVQLDYVHDRRGILKITGFTSATEVSALVLKRLPFQIVNNNYTYTGGYYDGGWAAWTPPADAVAHNYGTWRWAFGAFSNTRGWPTHGAIWQQRLCLAKGSTVYASVVADLTNFAALNEYDEQTADMAFTYTIEDANAIEWLVPDDRLLALTASGVFALGPANAAEGIGPTNLRADRQNNAGVAGAEPQMLDSRTIYIDRSQTRIYQADFDAQRAVENPEDLTRYARHMGNAGFVALAPQQHPFNHIWALRGDGSLACAAYLPDEDVLGFAHRPLADGLLAQSIATITDPAGRFDQVWIAATYAGAWHVLRMAPWRHDGEHDETACMMDMASAYDGTPIATTTIAQLGAGRTIHVAADGALMELTTGEGGAFTLPQPASRIWAGLPYPAYMESLDIEAGSDNGAATGKIGRHLRQYVHVLHARGLRYGSPSDGMQAGDMQDMEQLRTDSAMDAGFDAVTGLLFRHGGSHTRQPRHRIERVMPAQATILAWGTDMRREDT